MKTHYFFYFLLITTLLVPTTPLHAHKKGIIAIATIGIGTVGLYGFYKWLRSEETFQPTIDNLNTYTFKQISSKPHTQAKSLPQSNAQANSLPHASPTTLSSVHPVATPYKQSNSKPDILFKLSATTSPDAQTLSYVPENTRLSSPHKDSDSLFQPTIPSLSIDQLVIRINKNKSPQQAYVQLPAHDDTPNKILIAQKGITSTQDPTIFIFSRGYARTNTPGTNDNMLQKGGCAMAAYMPIHDNIINDAACITFDYPDRRRCFNFGQNKDIQCLQLIHEQTLKHNPHANIVLVGDCRGAKAILSFAMQQPKNIKALVLLSPFFSARQLTEQVAHNYLSWLPGASGILHNFFKLWFPSYNINADDSFVENALHISPDIPVFIAHRSIDTLVSTKQVTTFIDHLNATRNRKIHLFITDDTSARHSRLTPVKAIQQEVNRFLYTYNLPHNPALLTN